MAVYLDRFQKHFLWSNPKAVIAVFLPVQDHFLQRLAVTGDADDDLLVALVVPVATGE